MCAPPVEVEPALATARRLHRIAAGNPLTDEDFALGKARGRTADTAA